MSIFYQEEPSNPSYKKGKCLILALKHAFAKCHSFRTKVTQSSFEVDEHVSNFDEEEDEIFVSAIISKYMESKSKRKSNIGIDSFNWGLSPAAAAGDIIGTMKKCDNGDDEFCSANSRLSRCSSDTSFDAFVSAKTCLSRCSSLNGIDRFQEFGGDRRRSSVIMELINCEGWPFGLCRKALLLPPLPKSPADSWSWRKSVGIIRIH